MTPAETRQVAELHTNIAALLNAIASWRQECEAVQQHYREAVARADKAEQREFVSIAGPLMKEWIIDNEETLNDLPNDEAQEFLSNNIGQIRRSVKADLEFEKGIEVDLE